MARLDDSLELPFGGGAPGGPTLRQAARQASPVIERLARLGYAARGLVYILVGILALLAALSPLTRRPTDSAGALHAVGGGLSGTVILGALSAGLFGFALWRFVEAVLTPREVVPAKTWALRIGYVVSGIIHAGLALEAARLALGQRVSRSDGEDAVHWTAMAMQYPFGRWAVLGVGIIVIGLGLRELRSALREDFARKTRPDSLPPEVQRNLRRAGAFGTASRGVVFGVIGWFLIQAALQFDPSEARGLGRALETLQSQPYGPALLGATAVGLAGFGVWQLVVAKYRRISAA